MAHTNTIFLDHNATTSLRVEAREAMVEAMKAPLNASSIHSSGRVGRGMLESARNTICARLGADGAEVIFTASGTEANNLAIVGFADADAVAISAIEHVSVLEPAKRMQAIMLPVDEQGRVNVAVVDRILSAHADKRLLVSVMLANNETGVIQDITAIRDVVLKHRGFLHIDASQAVGKMKVDFNNLGCDMMTVSSHKCGGPQGAAALIVKSGLNLNAQIVGGGQEKFKRAGTENIVALAGFAAALDSLPNCKDIMGELRDKIEYSLRATCPDVLIASENVERLPNTSCLTMPGVDAHTQLMHFDLDGVAVSSGSACSSGKVGQSHVLAAMGWNKAEAGTAIRVSVGFDTTAGDVDAFVASWQRLYGRMRLKEAA